MKYLNKIRIFTLISNFKIVCNAHKINYITEKDIKESTKDKFYLYELEIDKKSMIKAPNDDKKRMIMACNNLFIFCF